MFRSVLVANRGEIAVRICKTLRTMGIRSVVVASIPDRHSLAVRSADAWVLLEGYSAAESYLDIDAVIAAAKAEGCEAIHPGYGFLSERADFAERCAADGMVFVGPPPAVLRGMGDKSAARRLAVENGVPVVPGWDGADDSETLTREAALLGYPVMLKARGGGGGRGMREVMTADDLPEAIESARREAQSAFGDGGLLIEKLVTRAHHVEVQVVADQHGSVIHLGERDCSVQRRHQKLIEETPSPVVDDALRAELTGAALRLARAINYINAGTFEFLVGEPEADGKRPFYFLEVNPRLQVEHPVTEMVTDLDLVELQLRVAAGEPLPLRQEEVKFEGHAIEFRIDAEDPWDNFKPSTGRITKGRWRTINGRIDYGFDESDVVPAQYDSLLAKIIVSGEARDDALSFAAVDLSESTLRPLVTNIQLHRLILKSETFREGQATIDWLESSLDSLVASDLAPANSWAAAAVALAGQSLGPRTVWLSDGHGLKEIEVLPRSRRGGDVRMADGSRAYEIVRWDTFRDHWERYCEVRIAGAEDLLSCTGTPDSLHCWVGRRFWRFQAVPPPPLPRRAPTAGAGATAITAPLAGTIVAIRVAEGDAVEAGQLIALLEAMKMEHRITAPSAGMVRSLAVRERDVVREGDVIAEVG